MKITQYAFPVRETKANYKRNQQENKVKNIKQK